MRTIITTVGTSLLTNREDNRPWAGWNPRKPDPLPFADEVDRWLASPSLNRVTASAEINTLRALEASNSDLVVFLYSDTPEGRFCAERLSKLYPAEGRAVPPVKIDGLGYHGAHRFSSGLKALVDIVIRLSDDAKKSGRTPVFCATGGFKAEIAFLNLIGALLEIEVFYIHELHRELVRLPRLPLTWNAPFVSRHDSFFSWIEETPRACGEVESRLKASPELRSLVEDDGEGHALLTAAGSLLFRVAREHLATGPVAVWPEADARPPAEKNRMSSKDHHRPNGWELFVNRLCAVDCVSLVTVAPSAHGGDRVKIDDARCGVFVVRFGDAGSMLPLRVGTTARGNAQCEMVAQYFRSLR